ncbi:MAG: hypothetical protein V4482_05510 [Pseudomonadota bacterium]
MINITREQFFSFIKTEKDKDGVVSKATQHYLDYFDKYQSTGKKGGWNWSVLIFSMCPFLFYFSEYAFVSSLFWFFYRRMYFYGILIPVTECILYFSFSFVFSFLYIKFAGNFDFGVLLEYGIYSGFIFIGIFDILIAYYADYIYLKHASKKVLKETLQSGVNKKLLITLIVILGLGALVGAYLLAKH